MLSTTVVEEHPALVHTMALILEVKLELEVPSLVLQTVNPQSPTHINNNNIQ